MYLSMSTCGTEREKLPDGSYRFDALDGLRQCAAAGFTHIDFNFAQVAVHCRPLSADDWKTWVASLREAADDLQLTVSQTHAHWFYPHLVPADELVWNNEMVRRSVEATAMLGKNAWMVTHPRSIYDAEGFNLQKTLEYNYAQCMELGELGKKHGVGIAIENLFPVPGRIDYAYTTEELLALLQRLNDPVFGICWDFGHANNAGLDHEQALEEIAPYLKVTHVHDNKRRGDDHFPPYFGNIPWEKVMTKLKEIGYGGSFNFEGHVYYLTLPRVLREEALRFLYSTGAELLRIYDKA